MKEIIAFMNSFKELDCLHDHQRSRVFVKSIRDKTIGNQSPCVYLKTQISIYAPVQF